MLRDVFEFDIDSFPSTDPLVYGFKVTLAMIEAYGGSVGDAGALFLLNVCNSRLPTWDTLPTDWAQESRSGIVADFIWYIGLYNAAVNIYNTADWIIGVASREQFAEAHRRLLRLEQLLMEGGWIRKPPDDLSLKTILRLPKERALVAPPSKGYFKKMIGGLRRRR